MEAFAAYLTESPNELKAAIAVMVMAFVRLVLAVWVLHDCRKRFLN